MENERGGLFLSSMETARAAVGMALMNLTYNLKRLATMIRLKVFDFAKVGAPRFAGNSLKKGASPPKTARISPGNRQPALGVAGKILNVIVRKNAMELVGA